jgi:hypothetical protein
MGIWLYKQYLAEKPGESHLPLPHIFTDRFVSERKKMLVLFAMTRQ